MNSIGKIHKRTALKMEAHYSLVVNRPRTWTNSFSTDENMQRFTTSYFCGKIYLCSMLESRVSILVLGDVGQVCIFEKNSSECLPGSWALVQMGTASLN